MPPNTAPRLLAGLARHAAGLALAFVCLVPLAWIVAASLRPLGLPPPRTIVWLPNPPAWSNYVEVFRLLPLARYTLNSLIVASLGVALTLVTASWAGLAMALAAPRWQGRLVALCGLLLLVPAGALWLPRFVLFTWLGLIDNYAALLAPALMGSSPLFVLLFYWTFKRMPTELFESAALDGAGLLTIWWRLALPLARATLMAVGILTFLLYWSDFINPLLFLKTPALYTLPIGVQQLKQMDQINWPLLLAAVVVMTAPAVALFAVVQRFFLGENKLYG
ncbi:MAG: carbohydrate ABC transporter permease [Anaerolineales bacterium]|nr:carbohydrate ABC transporter permease [Anaerolineales bacterium]